MLVCVNRRLERSFGTRDGPGVLREDLRTRRRFLVLTEVLELVLRDRQLHRILDDRGHLLRGHVTRAAEHARRDREPVEDVVTGIADDLIDVTNFLAVDVDDAPTLLDHEPGDGIGHQTERPPTYHTGPCVPTGYVSESARRI